MASRSELREKCMIILYQYDLLKNTNTIKSVDEIIKDNMEIENEFVKDIVYGVVTNQNELDSIANEYLKDWTIDRIDMVGASILRMALFEIKYTDTPEIVVINEAVNLAKKYCDEKLKNMINASLDKYIK